jgi:hypothetical protein
MTKYVFNTKTYGAIACTLFVILQRYDEPLYHQ